MTAASHHAALSSETDSATQGCGHRPRPAHGQQMSFFFKTFSCRVFVSRATNSRVHLVDRQDLTEFRSGVSFLSLKLTPAEAFDERRSQISSL